MGNIEFITFSGLIITLILFILKNRNENKTKKLNLFATKRYQKIMLHFPESLHHPNFDYEKLNPEQKDEILRYTRAYFDFCIEEFDLHLQKLIDKKVWEKLEGRDEICFFQTVREA